MDKNERPDEHGRPAQHTEHFRAELADEHNDPTPDPARPVAVGPPPRGAGLLVVTRGPNRGAQFLLDAAIITVGRHIDSDIFLDDVTVSRRHAEFRRDEDGLQVADVGSLNGTYRNGESVDTASLSDGDEIRIGKFRLTYITAAAAR
ncbi:FHA domain-containing protein [Antrihabitans cavernicola]|uniref:FHA domain-containing protein n=1 Tax=Antrihabitans cavernicola TaxID=2495913 RepID=UPI0035304762